MATRSQVDLFKRVKHGTHAEYSNMIAASGF